jgi:hypothetical protein
MSSAYRFALVQGETLFPLPGATPERNSTLALSAYLWYNAHTYR